MAYFEQLKTTKRGGAYKSLDSEALVGEWVLKPLHPPTYGEHSFFELTSLSMDGDLSNIYTPDEIPRVTPRNRRGFFYHDEKYPSDKSKTELALKGAEISSVPNRYISEQDHRKLAYKAVSAVPLAMGDQERHADINSQSRGNVHHIGARHTPHSDHTGHHFSHKHIMK